MRDHARRRVRDGRANSRPPSERDPHAHAADPARGRGVIDPMPWYSGDRGPMQVARAIGGVVNDGQRVRPGWGWDTPRPRTWPEQGAGVPSAPSDLGWARQEPVRTIRWLIQHGLLLPFTEAMAHPKGEGRAWVTGREGPGLLGG